MRRFYINPENISQGKAVLAGDEARHLQQVLRLQKGQQICLFDGAGTVYQAEITQISKSTVQALILASHEESNNPPYLDLAQCILKKKKMELIVQKSTELGVNNFLPIISQHCSLTYRPSTQEPRWQKIAAEACKQCGRSFIPEIRETANISDLFAAAHHEVKIILWENEAKNRLKPFDSDTPPNSVLLLIGPEGGFAEAEVSAALAAGFTPASLGNLTLRAETAAISALAISQYLLSATHPGALEK
jgi:16S rRNA (uracil1498-N3)-methyltransferase